MKWLYVVVLIFTLALCAAVNSAEPDSGIDKAQWQQAREYFSRQGSALENELFSGYSTAKQALLLGSTLWLNDETLTQKNITQKNTNHKNEMQKTLAQRLLIQAASQADMLNKFDQGYLYNLLASTYQRENNIITAAHYFNLSIDVEYPDACNNLGVMWEQQNNFKQAKETYIRCLALSKVFATPLLYLNLGTIYYNGAGAVNKNKLLGASYWQKSYDLFPFDADTNYNLGIYHLNETKRYAKARYYFAYCAFSDPDCSQIIASNALIGHYADKAYLKEVLALSAPYQRENLLSDRLKYAFNEAIYFDELTKNNLRFTIETSDNNQVTSVAVSFTQSEAERATLMLNRLIYLDMFTGLNLPMLKLKSAISKHKSATFEYLKQRHRLTYTEGIFVYSIELNN